MKRIALVTNAQRRCGINGYAWSAFDCLSTSSQYEYFVAESPWDAEHPAEKIKWLRDLGADAIIYNHCPLTLNWLNDKIMNMVNVPQFIITGHDHLYQSSVPKHIFCVQSVWTPPAEQYSSLPHAVARRQDLEYSPAGGVIKVGSFGIGTRGKNFLGTVDLVNKHFPTESVELNLHISTAVYKTFDAGQVPAIIEECKQRANPNVKVNISNEAYMDDRMELSGWLNKNDINIFCDKDDVVRFAESTCTDHAMMARKPLGITSNSKFKHLADVPEINLEHNNIKDIVAKGLQPLESAYAKWNPESYCKVIETQLAKYL
jgi:hypothetical protein